MLYNLGRRSGLLLFDGSIDLLQLPDDFAFLYEFDLLVFGFVLLSIFLRSELLLEVLQVLQLFGADFLREAFPVQKPLDVTYLLLIRHLPLFLAIATLPMVLNNPMEPIHLESVLQILRAVEEPVLLLGIGISFVALIPSVLYFFHFC